MGARREGGSGRAAGGRGVVTGPRRGGGGGGGGRGKFVAEKRDTIRVKYVCIQYYACKFRFINENEPSAGSQEIFT